MKNTFENQQNNIIRKDAKEATLNDENRFRSIYEESRAEYLWPKIFNILIAENNIDYKSQDKEWLNDYEENQSTFYGNSVKRNVDLNDQGEESKERKLMIKGRVKDKMYYSDVISEIELALKHHYEDIPEIIVLIDKESDSYMSSNLTVVELIRNKFSEFIKEQGLDEEREEWEKNLIQPIIISVSQQYTFNQNNLQQGADLAMTSFDAEEMEKIIHLVDKIKSSPASLLPEKLKRIKKKFYNSVEDQMKARAEITADTEKEIEILEKIFKEEKIVSVLDIGCGYGRLDLPLLQNNSTLYIDGIDSNEDSLKVLEQEFKKADLGGYSGFVKGDLINYGDSKDRNLKDCVMYNWHSLLEAFGPGNLLRTLRSACVSLRPGGVLIFDQPTRDNPGIEDGWYGDEPKMGEDFSYLSYVMDEEEIEFILGISGFDRDSIEIIHWKTKASEEYPDGMNKITVKAKKIDGKEQVNSIMHINL